MSSTQLPLDSLFSFAQRVNIRSELLVEDLELDVAAVQLAVHGQQSVLLLPSQQLPDLLVLSRYGILCAGGRFLQESVRRTSTQSGSSLAVSPAVACTCWAYLQGPWYPAHFTEDLLILHNLLVQKIQLAVKVHL